MRNGPAESSKAPTRTEADRESLKQQFDALREKRAEIERAATAVTEEIHLLMRAAHDAGWSWDAVAELSGYRSGAVARTQAAPVGAAGRPVHPPDTYTVRDAADRLGVTPQAIYEAIRTGRIQVADDRKRGRRVYLPSSSTALD